MEADFIDGCRYFQHIIGFHPRRPEGLVGVAEDSFGDSHFMCH